jgi:hypothetical protein
LATERWHDAEMSIELRPSSGPPPTGSAVQPAPGPFFSVTVRWEYTVIPAHPQRRFVCLSDRAEYVELAGERNDTSAWYLRPETGVDPSTREAFELLRFTVDGQERPIRRAVRKGGQMYTASIGTEAVTAGKPVTISCTYRTITGQADHLLFFDIEQPTRGLRVEMDYGGCAIASMAALDLVPTIRPTRIDRPPAVLDQDSVRVEVDGWVFPRSGVAFVWTLEGELETASDVASSDHLVPA